MAATTIARTEQVLAAARATRAAIGDLEVEQLAQAVEWATLHPGEEPDPAMDWAMRPLELAGDGAPTVDESAVAEFALAIGMKHEPGMRYVGDAVELCHRLPQLWARVCAGQVPVWKARTIAQATRTLPMPAAADIDQHLAWIAHRCSFAEIERQVERARAEHDPAETEKRRIAAAEERRFDIDLRHVSSDGLVAVSGMLDLADALTLEETIAAKAATLDPALPIDVRRSIAAGLLGSTDPQRHVVVYTHTRPDTAMVEVENTRSVITPEHLADLCQQAGTRVTIRPVLDLNTEHATDTYEPSPLIREQVWATHPTCVFPRCERPARGCDLDHRTPWPHGATATSNLYPLCRTHHRLKTTGDWTYHPTGATTVEWTSPLGLRHTG
jgi:hypothetical protein